MLEKEQRRPRVFYSPNNNWIVLDRGEKSASMIIPKKDINKNNLQGLVAREVLRTETTAKLASSLYMNFLGYELRARIIKDSYVGVNQFYSEHRLPQHILNLLGVDIGLAKTTKEQKRDKPASDKELTTENLMKLLGNIDQDLMTPETHTIYEKEFFELYNNGNKLMEHYFAQRYFKDLPIKEGRKKVKEILQSKKEYSI